jgi:hypothetical protein
MFPPTFRKLRLNPSHVELPGGFELVSRRRALAFEGFPEAGLGMRQQLSSIHAKRKVPWLHWLF